MSLQNDDRNNNLQLIAVPDTNLETDDPNVTTNGGPEESTKTDKTDTDLPPLIPDLLVQISDIL